MIGPMRYLGPCLWRHNGKVGQINDKKKLNPFLRQQAISKLQCFYTTVWFIFVFGQNKNAEWKFKRSQIFLFGRHSILPFFVIVCRKMFPDFPIWCFELVKSRLIWLAGDKIKMGPLNREFAVLNCMEMVFKSLIRQNPRGKDYTTIMAFEYLFYRLNDQQPSEIVTITNSKLLSFVQEFTFLSYLFSYHNI